MDSRQTRREMKKKRNLCGRQFLYQLSEYYISLGKFIFSLKNGNPVKSHLILSLFSNQKKAESNLRLFISQVGKINKPLNYFEDPESPDSKLNYRYSKDEFEFYKTIGRDFTFAAMNESITFGEMLFSIEKKPNISIGYEYNVPTNLNLDNDRFRFQITHLTHHFMQPNLLRNLEINTKYTGIKTDDVLNA